ncbi:UdgX family uracil-DNA binding protein [Stenotrophomonas sp. HITSZ_GD]|uniref:UdgX family uracil-DNA binding protein n=1 Tax=Stenotrophomonas sp. HITSZ_GD TaxID=3037248 RepID=UPI00240E6759|nr:UdgX family uracil-DNA binding protein [Stenotrophomonas sp. HITSZ_GD]MDG2525152.1 UdgX family uracil-DNA binding protein [Stenotrophomonas sp. HITSZ_GD]
MPRTPSPPLAKPVAEVPSGSLKQLRTLAGACRRCDLWKPATQTVFGAGPARARLMIIGEQPGDQEDLAGEPFVGPAGKLLRGLMETADLDPSAVWLTNTVKHFKFTPRGKRRLHQRANAGEQAACRPWLAAELLRVRPRIVLALGAMAAQTVFGNGFRLTAERGQWRDLDDRTRAMASWHPSAILRMREPERTATRALLLADLRAVRAQLDAGD